MKKYYPFEDPQEPILTKSTESNDQQHETENENFFNRNSYFSRYQNI